MLSFLVALAALLEHHTLPSAGVLLFGLGASLVDVVAAVGLFQWAIHYTR